MTSIEDNNIGGNSNIPLPLQGVTGAGITPTAIVQPPIVQKQIVQPPIVQKQIVQKPIVQKPIVQKPIVQPQVNKVQLDSNALYNQVKNNISTFVSATNPIAGGLFNIANAGYNMLFGDTKTKDTALSNLDNQMGGIIKGTSRLLSSDKISLTDNENKVIDDLKKFNKLSYNPLGQVGVIDQGPIYIKGNKDELTAELNALDVSAEKKQFGIDNRSSLIKIQLKIQKEADKLTNDQIKTELANYKIPNTPESIKKRVIELQGISLRQAQDNNKEEFDKLNSSLVNLIKAKQESIISKYIQPEQGKTALDTFVNNFSTNTSVRTEQYIRNNIVQPHVNELEKSLTYDIFNVKDKNYLKKMIDEYANKSVRDNKFFYESLMVTDDKDERAKMKSIMGIQAQARDHLFQSQITKASELLSQYNKNPSGDLAKGDIGKLSFDYGYSKLTNPEKQALLKRDGIDTVTSLYYNSLELKKRFNQMITSFNGNGSALDKSSNFIKYGSATIGNLLQDIGGVIGLGIGAASSQYASNTFKGDDKSKIFFDEYELTDANSSIGSKMLHSVLFNTDDLIEGIGTFVVGNKVAPIGKFANIAIKSLEAINLSKKGVGIITPIMKYTTAKGLTIQGLKTLAYGARGISEGIVGDVTLDRQMRFADTDYNATMNVMTNALFEPVIHIGGKVADKAYVASGAGALIKTNFLSAGMYKIFTGESTIADTVSVLMNEDGLSRKEAYKQVKDATNIFYSIIPNVNKAYKDNPRLLADATLRYREKLNEVKSQGGDSIMTDEGNILTLKDILYYNHKDGDNLDKIISMIKSPDKLTNSVGVNGLEQYKNNILEVVNGNASILGDARIDLSLKDKAIQLKKFKTLLGNIKEGGQLKEQLSSIHDALVSLHLSDLNRGVKFKSKIRLFDNIGMNSYTIDDKALLSLQTADKKVFDELIHNGNIVIDENISTITGIKKGEYSTTGLDKSSVLGLIANRDKGMYKAIHSLLNKDLKDGSTAIGYNVSTPKGMSDELFQSKIRGLFGEDNIIISEIQNSKNKNTRETITNSLRNQDSIISVKFGKIGDKMTYYIGVGKKIKSKGFDNISSSTEMYHKQSSEIIKNILSKNTFDSGLKEALTIHNIAGANVFDDSYKHKFLGRLFNNFQKEKILVEKVNGEYIYTNDGEVIKKFILDSFSRTEASNDNPMSRYLFEVFSIRVLDNKELYSSILSDIEKLKSGLFEGDYLKTLENLDTFTQSITGSIKINGGDVKFKNQFNQSGYKIEARKRFKERNEYLNYQLDHLKNDLAINKLVPITNGNKDIVESNIKGLENNIDDINTRLELSIDKFVKSFTDTLFRDSLYSLMDMELYRDLKIFENLPGKKMVDTATIVNIDTKISNIDIKIDNNNITKKNNLNSNIKDLQDEIIQLQNNSTLINKKHSKYLQNDIIQLQNNSTLINKKHSKYLQNDIIQLQNNSTLINEKHSKDLQDEIIQLQNNSTLINKKHSKYLQDKLDDLDIRIEKSKKSLNKLSGEITNDDVIDLKKLNNERDLLQEKTNVLSSQIRIYNEALQKDFDGMKIFIDNKSHSIKDILDKGLDLPIRELMTSIEYNFKKFENEAFRTYFFNRLTIGGNNIHIKDSINFVRYDELQKSIFNYNGNKRSYDNALIENPVEKIIATALTGAKNSENKLGSKFFKNIKDSYNIKGDDITNLRELYLNNNKFKKEIDGLFSKDIKTNYNSNTLDAYKQSIKRLKIILDKGFKDISLEFLSGDKIKLKSNEGIDKMLYKVLPNILDKFKSLTYNSKRKVLKTIKEGKTFKTILSVDNIGEETLFHRDLISGDKNFSVLHIPNIQSLAYTESAFLEGKNIIIKKLKKSLSNKNPDYLSEGDIYAHIVEGINKGLYPEIKSDIGLDDNQYIMGTLGDKDSYLHIYIGDDYKDALNKYYEYYTSKGGFIKNGEILGSGVIGKRESPLASVYRIFENIKQDTNTYILEEKLNINNRTLIDNMLSDISNNNTIELSDWNSLYDTIRSYDNLFNESILNKFNDKQKLLTLEKTYFSDIDDGTSFISSDIGKLKDNITGHKVSDKSIKMHATDVIDGERYEAKTLFNRAIIKHDGDIKNNIVAIGENSLKLGTISKTNIKTLSIDGIIYNVKGKINKTNLSNFVDASSESKVYKNEFTLSRQILNIFPYDIKNAFVDLFKDQIDTEVVKTLSTIGNFDKDISVYGDSAEWLRNVYVAALGDSGNDLVVNGKISSLLGRIKTIIDSHKIISSGSKILKSGIVLTKGNSKHLLSRSEVVISNTGKIFKNIKDSIDKEKKILDDKVSKGDELSILDSERLDIINYQLDNNEYYISSFRNPVPTRENLGVYKVILAEDIGLNNSINNSLNVVKGDDSIFHTESTVVKMEADHDGDKALIVPITTSEGLLLAKGALQLDVKTNLVDIINKGLIDNKIAAISQIGDGIKKSVDIATAESLINNRLKNVDAKTTIGIIMSTTKILNIFRQDMEELLVLVKDKKNNVERLKEILFNKYKGLDDKGKAKIRTFKTILEDLSDTGNWEDGLKFSNEYSGIVGSAIQIVLDFAKSDLTEFPKSLWLKEILSATGIDKSKSRYLYNNIVSPLAMSTKKVLDKISMSGISHYSFKKDINFLNETLGYQSDLLKHFFKTHGGLLSGLMQGLDHYTLLRTKPVTKLINNLKLLLKDDKFNLFIDNVVEGTYMSKKNADTLLGYLYEGSKINKKLSDKLDLYGKLKTIYTDIGGKIDWDTIANKFLSDNPTDDDKALMGLYSLSHKKNIMFNLLNEEAKLRYLNFTTFNRIGGKKQSFGYIGKNSPAGLLQKYNKDFNPVLFINENDSKGMLLKNKLLTLKKEISNIDIKLNNSKDLVDLGKTTTIYQKKIFLNDLLDSKLAVEKELLYTNNNNIDFSSAETIAILKEKINNIKGDNITKDITKYIPKDITKYITKDITKYIPKDITKEVSDIVDDKGMELLYTNNNNIDLSSVETIAILKEKINNIKGDNIPEDITKEVSDIVDDKGMELLSDFLDEDITIVEGAKKELQNSVNYLTDASEQLKGYINIYKSIVGGKKEIKNINNSKIINNVLVKGDDYFKSIKIVNEFRGKELIELNKDITYSNNIQVLLQRGMTTKLVDELTRVNPESIEKMNRSRSIFGKEGDNIKRIFSSLGADVFKKIKKIEGKSLEADGIASKGVEIFNDLLRSNIIYNTKGYSFDIDGFNLLLKKKLGNVSNIEAFNPKSLNVLLEAGDSYSALYVNLVKGLDKMDKFYKDVGGYDISKYSNRLNNAFTLDLISSFTGELQFEFRRQGLMTAGDKNVMTKQFIKGLKKSAEVQGQKITDKVARQLFNFIYSRESGRLMSIIKSGQGWYYFLSYQLPSLLLGGAGHAAAATQIIPNILELVSVKHLAVLEQKEGNKLLKEFNLFGENTSSVGQQGSETVLKETSAQRLQGNASRLIVGGVETILDKLSNDIGYLKNPHHKREIANIIDTMITEPLFAVDMINDPARRIASVNHVMKTLGFNNASELTDYAKGNVYRKDSIQSLFYSKYNELGGGVISTSSVYRETFGTTFNSDAGMIFSTLYRLLNGWGIHKISTLIDKSIQMGQVVKLIQQGNINGAKILLTDSMDYFSSQMVNIGLAAALTLKVDKFDTSSQDSNDTSFKSTVFGIQNTLTALEIMFSREKQNYEGGSKFSNQQGIAVATLGLFAHMTRFLALGRIPLTVKARLDSEGYTATNLFTATYEAIQDNVSKYMRSQFLEASTSIYGDMLPSDNISLTGVAGPTRLSEAVFSKYRLNKNIRFNEENSNFIAGFGKGIMGILVGYVMPNTYKLGDEVLNKSVEKVLQDPAMKDLSEGGISDVGYNLNQILLTDGKIDDKEVASLYNSLISYQRTGTRFDSKGRKVLVSQKEIDTRTDDLITGMLADIGYSASDFINHPGTRIEGLGKLMIELGQKNNPLLSTKHMIGYLGNKFYAAEIKKIKDQHPNLPYNESIKDSDRIVAKYKALIKMQNSGIFNLSNELLGVAADAHFKKFYKKEASELRNLYKQTEFKDYMGGIMIAENNLNAGDTSAMYLNTRFSRALKGAGVVYSQSITGKRGERLKLSADSVKYNTENALKLLKTVEDSTQPFLEKTAKKAAIFYGLNKSTWNLLKDTKVFNLLDGPTKKIISSWLYKTNDNLISADANSISNYQNKSGYSSRFRRPIKSNSRGSSGYGSGARPGFSKQFPHMKEFIKGKDVPINYNNISSYGTQPAFFNQSLYFPFVKKINNYIVRELFHVISNPIDNKSKIYTRKSGPKQGFVRTKKVHFKSPRFKRHRTNQKTYSKFTTIKGLPGDISTN